MRTHSPGIGCTFARGSIPKAPSAISYRSRSCNRRDTHQRTPIFHICRPGLVAATQPCPASADPSAVSLRVEQQPPIPGHWLWAIVSSPGPGGLTLLGVCPDFRSPFHPFCALPSHCRIRRYVSHVFGMSSLRQYATNFTLFSYLPRTPTSFSQN